MTSSVAVLYCDSRWGEIDQWVIGYPDEEMRIDDTVKNAIGYIVQKTQTGSTVYEKEIGTAFFVSVPAEKLPDTVFPYIVAARHVVYNLKGNPEPNLYLRVNFKNGP